jgi:hypothetical protein
MKFLASVHNTLQYLYLKCRMNAPATFFDKILTFAGDEIRPEYQLVEQEFKNH